jgi:PEGA domain
LLSCIPEFRASLLAATIIVFFGISGCGGVQKNDGPGPRGTVRFSGEPGDARIEVDETHLGPLNMFEKKGVLLKPGSHRIIVRADGYFPEYQIIEIKENELLVVEIELRAVPE